MACGILDLIRVQKWLDVGRDKNTPFHTQIDGRRTQRVACLVRDMQEMRCLKLPGTVCVLLQHEAVAAGEQHDCRPHICSCVCAYVCLYRQGYFYSCRYVWYIISWHRLGRTYFAFSTSCPFEAVALHCPRFSV